MAQPFLYLAVTTTLHLMLTESLFISAFFMGLLGGTHCVGMCGGIVSGLTMGLPENERNKRNRLLTYLISYNSGRILSYAIAGAVVATLGMVAENIGSGMDVRRWFTLIAALVMILLGLYLTGWWTSAILGIERAGSIVWRLIEPMAKKFIPIRSTTQAMIAGMLWGWLPCGLVYTALLWSMTAESSLQGAMVMISFGIGTLPTLLGLGYFSNSLISKLQKGWVRTTMGITVAGFGLYQLQALYLL